MLLRAATSVDMFARTAHFYAQNVAQPRSSVGKATNCTFLTTNSRVAPHTATVSWTFLRAKRLTARVAVHIPAWHCTLSMCLCILTRKMSRNHVAQLVKRLKTNCTRRIPVYLEIISACHTNNIAYCLRAHNYLLPSRI